MLSYSQWFAPGHRLVVLTGLLVFLLPACSINVAHGSSVPFSLLLILAFITVPFLGERQQLERIEFTLLLTFAAFFLWAVISTYVNGVSEMGIRALGKYARLLFFIPAYFLFRRLRPSVGWLLAGLAAGSTVAGIYAILEIGFGMPNDYPGRASGAENPIYFGGIALLMAFMALSLIKTCPAPKLKSIVIISSVFGITACLLSYSRGGWVALPILSSILLIQHRQYLSRKTIASIVVGVVALLVLAYSLPQTGISTRVENTIAEMQKYEEAGTIDTSVGHRLAMWKIAVQLFKENPLVGVGPGNFNENLLRLVAEGKADSVLLAFFAPHNEYLHVLATRGIIGFITLMALLIVPSILFYRFTRDESEEKRGLAFAGLNVTAAYSVYALTASQFERVLPVVCYAFFVMYIAAMLFSSDLNTVERKDVSGS